MDSSVNVADPVVNFVGFGTEVMPLAVDSVLLVR